MRALAINVVKKGKQFMKIQSALRGLLAAAATAVALSTPTHANSIKDAQDWLAEWDGGPIPAWITDNYYLPGTETLAIDEIRVSACGTGMPANTRKQAATCFLVETGNGEVMMFDAGSGSYANIVALQIPADKLTKVFLSHLHTDHMAELSGVWAGGWISGRASELHVYGPSGRLPELGTAAAMEHFVGYNFWDQQTRAANLNPIPGNIIVHEFDYKGVNQVVHDENGVVVRTIPALHTGDGPVSYIIEYAGKKVVFSGDTFPTRWFLDHAQDADLLIHEVFHTPQQLVDILGFVPPVAMTVGTFIHTSPEAFGKVVETLQPRHAVGFHFYDIGSVREEIEAGVRNVYQGPLSLAQDLMVWNIRNDEITERMAIDDPDAIPAPTSAPIPAADPNNPAAPYPFTQYILDGGLYQEMLPVMNPRLDAFCSKYNFCGVQGADWRTRFQQ